MYFLSQFQCSTRMLFFFEHTNSHRVSFVNAVTGKGVSMYYPDFESLAIWTPIGGKASFLCLEPWNGSAIFHQDEMFSLTNTASLHWNQAKKKHIILRFL